MPDKTVSKVTAENRKYLHRSIHDIKTYTNAIVIAIFHVNFGLPVATMIFLLHLFLTSASSQQRSKLFTPSLTPSNQVSLRCPSVYVVSPEARIAKLFNNF